MKKMSNYKIIKNNKGQISDAITWVVATLIIIFLIVVSIYISSLMGKSKSIEDKNVILSKGEVLDWIKSKTEFAYGINIKDKVKIEEWVNKRDINGI